MATFEEVKNTIDEQIADNGQGKITGGILNGVLHDMVGATEKGLNEKANKSDITDEVYIGETEPTDEKVKVWINPNEEANTIQARTTSGGGTSGGVLKVWAGGEELTEGHKAENAATYNQLMVGVQFVMICVGVEGLIVQVFTPQLIQISYPFDDVEGEVYIMYNNTDEDIAFTLLSDGSIRL